MEALLGEERHLHAAVAQADDDRPKAQGFPLHALPEGWRWIAGNLHDTIGFPIDYTASAMLFSASVAIGASLKITPKRGWTEPATLWLALVGRPGATKTHPLTMMLKPLNDRDKESARQYTEELKQHEAEVKLARKEEGRETPARPECAQHLLGDTTPEALAEALGRNPRGVGVHRDELSGWVADFGRYSNGGEVQAYLSIWSAQPLRVNRVKSQKPLFVECPFVSVCGTIQPGVLGGLVADGRGKNGFIDRILFAYPEEQDMATWTEAEPDARIADHWTSFLNKLLAIPQPGQDAQAMLLRLSPQAMERWVQYHGRLKAEVDGFNRDGDEARAGHRTKMLSYTLRLALIHAAATWAEGNGPGLPTQVEASSLSAAIALADYFTTTADKVLFTLNESTPVDGLAGKRLKLFRALPVTFTTAKAVVVGENLGIPKRSVERYLGDGKIYHRHREGGSYTKRHEG
ncbi:MAG: DUF3987 domain-containing protein [Flavobacteriales bacterium]